MNTLRYTFLLLLLSYNCIAQPKDLKKDDSTTLSIKSLMELSTFELTKLDNELTIKKFVLGEVKTNADFAAYYYVNKNTFSFKRFLTVKKVVYIVEFLTEGINKIYLNEISDLKMKFINNDLSDDQINAHYEDDKGTLAITISKRSDYPHLRTQLTITITPLLK